MPTLSELAQAVNAALIGDGTRSVSSCNTLMDATPDQISLLHNAKYAKELETTKAAAVVVPPGMVKSFKRAEGLPELAFLEAKNTYYAWQQIMLRLHGQRTHAAVGISPQASIHPTAKLGKNVSIHPFAIIGENVTLGDNVHIYPHVTLMHDSTIGNDTILYPGVTVYESCTIGNRCLISAGAVIGSDGFAYAQANGIHHKMPQPGGLVIEDDVEIGCHTLIERGALKPTLIERGTKIGGTCIIGHNCRIGIGNIIISATCIAGSTTTGKYVVIAGQVGIAGHLDIPDFVKIGAQSGVMTNPEPNTEIVGTPAMEAGLMKRIVLNQMRLPDLAKRIKELETQVEKLSKTEPQA
ncbi:MAG TPA: UDP-3-O-(3-hydroxymyristoyl)glucosamine N-acyltransferase [Phycisphaerae bacterium]|nr:UDP-3-O-(3-hydroxymyristoyl)glucosamine N-acyltransferase [Phycisphaerae bacterium]